MRHRPFEASQQANLDLEGFWTADLRPAAARTGPAE